MGELILRNVNIVNLVTGCPLMHADVSISNGKIREVLSADNARNGNSKDEESIDASGLWVMPGFVDMHAHVTFSHLESGETMHSDAESLELAEDNLRTLASAGVVLVRDMGSFNNQAEKAKSKYGDDWRYPALLTCGKVITYPSGHMCELGVEVTDADQAVVAVNDNKHAGADFIKVASDPKDVEATRRTPNPALDVGVLSAIVSSANNLGMHVGIHTYPSYEGVARAGLARVRTIEHAAIDRSMCSSDACDAVHFVPTFVTAVDACGLSNLEGKIEGDSPEYEAIKSMTTQCAVYDHVPKSLLEWFDILMQDIPESIQADLPLCIGTDAGCEGTDFRSVIREALLFRVLGASNLQVLRSLALTPYRALGVRGGGRIEPGCPAGLVLLRNNPLEDLGALSEIEYLINKGRVAFRA